MDSLYTVKQYTQGILQDNHFKRPALLENNCHQESSACCITDVLPRRKYEWVIYDGLSPWNIVYFEHISHSCSSGFFGKL